MNQLEQVHREMKACRRCLEAGYDIAPGAIFSGSTEAEVMIIGQAPGLTEVEAQRPFNASSGRRLFAWLEAAGWTESDFRKQHYMTAVTKCYPGKHPSGRGDRVPTSVEQSFCRSFLEAELALVRPRLILPVGGLAIKLWFPASIRLREVIGRAAYFPPGSWHGGAAFDLSRATVVDTFDATLSAKGRWLVPLPHPSGASAWPNRPRNRALIDKALAILAEIRQVL